MIVLLINEFKMDVVHKQVKNVLQLMKLEQMPDEEINNENIT